MQSLVAPVTILAASNPVCNASVQLSHTTSAYPGTGRMKDTYILSRQDRDSKDFRVLSMPNFFQALSSMREIWVFHRSSSENVNPMFYVS